MQTIPPPRWTVRSKHRFDHWIDYDEIPVFCVECATTTFVGTMCRLLNTLSVTPDEFNDGNIPEQLNKKRRELADLKLAVGDLAQHLNILVGR